MAAQPAVLTAAIMNLFIGNLNLETSEQHLRDLFSEFGNIVSVKIIMDPQTAMPKGFGFVEMEDKFAAYDAMDNLDVTYFMGNIINVREARSNKQGGGVTRSGNGRPFQKRAGGNALYGNQRGGSYGDQQRNTGYRQSGFSGNRGGDNNSGYNQ